MKCPYCGFPDSKVTDSRDTAGGDVIRRRRECEKCQARFSTYERVELLNLTVEKRNGKEEEYKREKLEEGLRRATNKRMSEEDFAGIFSEIETEINARGKCRITSKEIGEIVLKKLKKKDEVAYLRFASVFKSFGSGERFVKEIGKL